MEIKFLGATGTVTGSRYLVSTGGRQILVDCGLFQGLKQLRLRNREPFAVDPASIEAVVLTHAHLDHSGYLPLFVRNGFTGPIYCTPATRRLCEILLPDSGHLQEEEAAFANRHGFSRHHPAEPLYTQQDAVRSLEQLRPVPFAEKLDMGGGLSVEFQPAGHILGAAMASLSDGHTRILFSGDLGRPDDPLLPSPARIRETDYLLVESTYGDRLHGSIDTLDHLEQVVKSTAGRGGVVLIPSFAVGRAQHILYLLHRLKAEKRIPDLPIYLDSPMAGRATRVFVEESEGQRLSDAEREAISAVAEPVETVADSKAIDQMRYPRIIISASGMATGGRVVHHLKVFAPDPKNTILFAGFQAAGTRGAAILGGAPSVKIHGSYVPVRAETALLENLSAHADYSEILDWLGAFETPPVQTFVTHGEPVAADALRHRIEEQLGWNVRVPEYLETVSLQGANSERRKHGGNSPLPESTQSLHPTAP
ncbi:MAG: MBL fold metallo-hydrolase [Gemmatimonadetes bacterium]|nr:MBL fold metallo-hydrolase [Gemmatimonadota bacterium]